MTSQSVPAVLEKQRTKRTEHEDLEDEQAETNSIVRQRPGLSSRFVRAIYAQVL